MRGRGFSIILIASMLLTACSGGEEGGKSGSYLPDSSGELAEIVVIYDKAGTDDAFRAEVDSVFGQKVRAIPAPSEPRFKVIYTDETFLKGYFKRHHNIFVLLTSGNLDRLVKTYGENNRARIEEIISKKEVLGFNKEDVWAKNQRIFYVTGANEQELLEKMHRRSSELMDIANNNEAISAKRKVFNKSIAKDTFYQHTMADRGYAVRKPITYKVAVKTPDFTLLTKESNAYLYGIMLYHTPYTSREQFDRDHIISLRESFTKRYVQDEIEGSYMSISPVIIPDTMSVNHNGHYAMRTDGWWRMSGRFMAGPFMSHAVYDEKQQRIVVAEGYIYGPNRKKATPLREVETIIKSLDIQ